MAIRSMTGFARREGQWSSEGTGDTPAEQYRWAWEIRTVNGRGLDIRCRMPSGYDGLDALARKLVPAQLGRGSVSVNLQLSSHGGSAPMQVNRKLLDEILSLASELQGKIAADPPRLDGLLSLRGVLEPADGRDPEAESAQRKALEKLLGEELEQTLAELVQARAQEGARLEDISRNHLRTIGEILGQIRAAADAQPEILRKRFNENLQTILDNLPQLSEDRLAQEVAVLCTRADVREEIDRLAAHIEEAFRLLDLAASEKSEPVGRKLDFLCQEFNREANTICSKSADLDLTAAGLAMKAAIDQFREQVQNIE